MEKRKNNFISGSFYFLEKPLQGIGRFLNASTILYSGRTKYQTIELFESPLFGKVLLLDGLVQISEYDEHIYHEALVHPTLLSIDSPETVLIIGGGDGGALRQVLKHKTVKRAVLVDLDREVIEFSKKYFPKMKAAFEDPRTEVIIGDGMKFIEEETNEKFDFVIIDLTDPSGPSRLLYTKEFYEMVKNILTKKGAIVTHAESLYVFQTYFAIIYRTLSSVFKYARPYYAYVPSFGFLWGYVTASDTIDPLSLNVDELKKRIEDRGVDTEFYYPELHKALFTLPKDVLKAINSPDVPISTMKNPVEITERE
ncbi:MAG: polyamine aminopropyltransferase [Candidatus Asgardarchaeia archaeon]